jgi:hypothetical protein
MAALLVLLVRSELTKVDHWMHCMHWICDLMWDGFQDELWWCLESAFVLILVWLTWLLCAH